MREEAFPRSSYLRSAVVLPLKDAASGKANGLQEASAGSSRTTPLCETLHGGSFPAAHVIAVHWWEQKRQPRERGPTFATWQASPLPARSHGGTLVSGAPAETLQRRPSARQSPASLKVLFTCLAAIAIPAMGRRGPVERQLLGPEILPKNPQFDLLPTQPPLLHHSAQSLPMT